jgi:hypothetical protein
MDMAEFVRKHRDDIIEKQQKHIFFSDLTEVFGSIYNLRTEYDKINFFVPRLSLIEQKILGKFDAKMLQSNQKKLL